MKSSPKPTAKNYFSEISSFDLFFQLIYMSATAAAGISRARVFELARSLPNAPAQYFRRIHEAAESLRFNYPDAVRLVGEKTKHDALKTFLLRLSDALRSGEPLPGFLEREANVLAEHYSNDYLRQLESLKKWTDAYTSVTVSAALIVIINMVSTMIYNLGEGTMAMMIMVALAGSFGIAWVLFRGAPQETLCVPLAKGSKEQRLSLKLFTILTPLMIATCALLFFFKIKEAYVLIVAGMFLMPTGIMANIADGKTCQKDTEISTFLRSLGGIATSRGTTLKEALSSIRLDSFPALQTDILRLNLRLKAYISPRISWDVFGLETGSQLAHQAVGVFYEAIDLGGDPERSGAVTSAFAMRTAMLRAQRRGVSSTFSYLILVMHTIMAGLMVFLMGILEQFALKLNEAMVGIGDGANAGASLGLQNMFAFGAPQLTFLSTITVGMILMLALINAFAIVASEGSHLIKMNYYLGILMILSALCFIFVPSLVHAVM